MSKILISACLVGENVKYNGKNNFHETAKKLVDDGLAVSVCPEVLGGLSIPRVPSEIIGDNVFTENGDDVTNEFMSGAQKTLEIALKHECDLAILQSRSPSCGSKVIYDGSFSRKLIEGQGVTTKLLREHGIRVVTLEEYIETLTNN